MEVSRRDFLKLSGAGTGGALLAGALGAESVLAAPPDPIRLHKKMGEKTTICPYCGAGCGFIVAAENGKVVNVEGDPDHPINRGAACPKGASIRQLAADNPLRLTKVLYRAPGAADWEEKSWDWAVTEIAKRIKATRDANWIEKDGDGNTVRRTEGVACLGGSALDNEECYLLGKMARALGVVYIEHHARL